MEAKLPKLQLKHSRDSTPTSRKFASTARKIAGYINVYERAAYPFGTQTAEHTRRHAQRSRMRQRKLAKQSSLPSFRPVSQGSIQINLPQFFRRKRHGTQSAIDLTTEEVSMFQQRPFLEDPARLEYQIQKCSSDLIEFMRDLSTYEYSANKASRCQQCVQQVQSRIMKLDHGIGELQQDNAGLQQVYAAFGKAFKEINQATECSLVRQLKPVAIRVEDFKLKQPNYWVKSKCVYSKSRMISGLHCLVRVFADCWFRFVSVQVYVTSGEVLMLNAPEHLLNVCYTDSEAIITEEIEARLLRYIYFQVADDMLRLEFDNTSPTRSKTLILNTKNHEVICVRISRKAKTYFIKSETYGSIRAPTITNLHQNLNVIDDRLVWEPPNQTFTEVEADSKFMDEDYVEAIMIKSFYEVKRRAALTIMDTDVVLTVYKKQGKCKTLMKIGPKPEEREES